MTTSDRPEEGDRAVLSLTLEDVQELHNLVGYARSNGICQYNSEQWKARLAAMQVILMSDTPIHFTNLG